MKKVHIREMAIAFCYRFLHGLQTACKPKTQKRRKAAEATFLFILNYQ